MSTSDNRRFPVSGVQGGNVLVSNSSPVCGRGRFQVLGGGERGGDGDGRTDGGGVAGSKASQENGHCDF